MTNYISRFCTIHILFYFIG